MSAPVTVRTARPQDLDAVARVEAASFDHDPWTAPRLAALLDRGAAWLLVATGARDGRSGDSPDADANADAGAEADADVVKGHCLAQVIADEAEILSLATHPHARDQGVGTALLAALGARGRGAGITTIFLDVSEANGPARRLYERGGYREVGRRAGYYADGSDGLLMRLDLSPRPTA